MQEGLTLAQEPCAAKSNEIAAFPRLLDRLILEGAVVTIDAAGCQKAIVQALREAGADYVLALKRNPRTLHGEVKAAFDEAARGPCDPRWRTAARPSSATAAAASGAPDSADAGNAPCATTSRAGPRTQLPRRHGHPAPGRPEHGAHGSTESRPKRVHRAPARPYRTPALAPGPQPALNPTLRLPWSLALSKVRLPAKRRPTGLTQKSNLALKPPLHHPCAQHNCCNRQ